MKKKKLFGVSYTNTKHSKFRSVKLEHFIEHKPLIYEELPMYVHT